MESVTIAFTSGEKIVVKEGQTLIPIVRSQDRGKMYASYLDPLDVCSDATKSMVYRIVNMLCSCDYFSTSDEFSEVYSAAAVLSVRQN